MSTKFLWDAILAIFDQFIIKHIISKWDVLWVIHNFIELKSLANNAKIRFLLKFLLKRCINVAIQADNTLYVHY